MNGEVGLFTITLVLILVLLLGDGRPIIIAMAAGTIISIPMGLTGVPRGVSYFHAAVYYAHCL